MDEDEPSSQDTDDGMSRELDELELEAGPGDKAGGARQSHMFSIRGCAPAAQVHILGLSSKTGYVI